ncbi:MAG: peptidoglycan editing factor PgeF [Mariprofundaceae bacterium]
MLAKVLTSKLLSQLHCPAIFTTRRGGISPSPFDSLNLGLNLGDLELHIQHNLQQVCQQNQIPVPHQSQQVHGCQVMFCTGAGIQHPQPADILISQTPNTALAVRTADCLPILLYEPYSHTIAAVHAGWRGTAQSIAQIAIASMLELGAKAEFIRASLGPAIGSCCFEVDHATAITLAQTHTQARSKIRFTQKHAYPDLQAINSLQLQAAGLKQQHIESLPACTSCLDESFFSYRRDGAKSGRQLAMITLPRNLSDLA